MFVSTIIGTTLAVVVGLHQMDALPVLKFQMDEVESDMGDLINDVDDRILKVGDSGKLTERRMLQEMVASRRRQLHENLRAQDKYKSDGMQPPAYFSREEADLRGAIIDIERELR